MKTINYYHEEVLGKKYVVIETITRQYINLEDYEEESSFLKRFEINSIEEAKKYYGGNFAKIYETATPFPKEPQKIIEDYKRLRDFKWGDRKDFWPIHLQNGHYAIYVFSSRDEEWLQP